MRESGQLRSLVWQRLSGQGFDKCENSMRGVKNAWVKEKGEEEEGEEEAEEDEGVVCVNHTLMWTRVGSV